MERGKREAGEESRHGGWKIGRGDLAAGGGALVSLLHPLLPDFTVALPVSDGLALFPEPPAPVPLATDLSAARRAAYLARLAGLAAFLKFHGLAVAWSDVRRIGARAGEPERPALASPPVPEWRGVAPSLLVAALAARLGGGRVSGKDASGLRSSVESALESGLDGPSSALVVAGLRTLDTGGTGEALVGELARKTGSAPLGPDLLGLAYPPVASENGGPLACAAGPAAPYLARGLARHLPGAGFVECGAGPALVDGGSLARLARALGGDPRAEGLASLAAGQPATLPAGPPLTIVAVDVDGWDERSRRVLDREIPAAGFRVVETRRTPPPPWLRRTGISAGLEPADVASLLWLPFRSLPESAHVWESLARHAAGDPARFLRAARSLAAAFDPAARTPASAIRFVTARRDADPVLDAASVLAAGFGTAEAARAAGVTEEHAASALREAVAVGVLAEQRPGLHRFVEEPERVRRLRRLPARARRSIVGRLDAAGFEGERLVAASLSRGDEADLAAARVLLGVAAERGDQELVADLLVRAPESDPDLGRPDLAVEVFLARGRLEEARRSARRMAGTDLGMAPLPRRRALARRLARLGEAAPALAIVGSDGSGAEQLARAQILLDLRRNDEAEALLARLPETMSADERLAAARLGAEISSRREDLEEALARLEPVADLLASSADSSEAFETAMTAGHLAVDRARHGEARTWFRRARDAAVEPRFVADATLNLSVASLLDGRFAEAETELSEALARYAEAGDEERYLSALGNRIDLEMRTGRFAAARETLATVLPHERRPGREHQFLFCVPALQELALLAGDDAAAAEAYCEADTRLNAARGHPALREILILEAERLLADRKPKKALELLSRAKALPDNREQSEPRRRRLALSARIDLGESAGDVSSWPTDERPFLSAELALAAGMELPSAALLELERRVGDGRAAAGVAARLLEWKGRFPRWFSLPAAAEWLALGERAAVRAGLPEAARRLAASRRAASLAPRSAGPAPMDSDPDAPGAVAEDASTRAVFAQVRRIAPTTIPVLILGETGTGKEIVARTLHRLSGRPGRFVAVNVAALTGSLIESELFGHARGAFTGADRDRPGLVEEASGGTLFLDEIGDLPLPLQGKLLRVLQEREVRRVGETKTRRVDLRVVAATHRDLASMAEAGTFRPDLLYRLRGLEVALGPLRNRPKDLARIVEIALDDATLSAEAWAAVRRHAWPGNVRELLSALESARALAAPGRVVEFEHLPAPVRSPRGKVPQPASYRMAVAEARLASIQGALDETGGNRTRAAKRLGISRQSLLHGMKVLGLGGPRPGGRSGRKRVP